MVSPDFFATFRRCLDEEPERLIFTMLDSEAQDKESLTYRTLYEGAQCIARDLKSRRKLNKGDRVLLFYLPGLPFIEALLGCMWAELIPVPVATFNPMYPNEWLKTVSGIANDCVASAILTQSTLRKLKWLGSVKDFFSRKENHWPDLPWYDTTSVKKTDTPIPIPTTTRDQLAFLQYTSGSTGAPKGVCMTYGNLSHQLTMNQDVLGINRETSSVLWVPHFHDFCLISGILSAVAVCGHLHLMSPIDFIQKPVRWLQAITRTRATHVAAPNFALEILTRKVTEEELSELDLHSLVVFMSAAEPIKDRTVTAFIKKFGRCGFDPRAFCPSYGLAEHTVGVTLHGKNALTLDQRVLETRGHYQADPTGTYKLWSCGYPMPGVRLKIVDPETQIPSPDGHIGEIWVDSPSKSPGYWGMEAENPKLMHARYQGQTEDGGYLRTGDLGFLHEGALYVSGRLKDLIIVRGRNIAPQDIEHSVQDASADIRPGKVIAFGRQSEGDEEVLVFAEQRFKKPMSEAACAALAEKVRNKIANQHQVNLRYFGILIPGNLPMSSSGKPQRRKCARLFAAGNLEQHHGYDFGTQTMHPRNPTPSGPSFAEIRAGVGQGFANLAKTKQGRATHTFGIGGKGHFRFDPDPTLPHHELWQNHGRAWLRHASIKGFADDAVLDGRGASLRIELPDGAYQDLIMSTGTRFFRATAASFFEWFAADLDGRSEILAREPRIAKIVADIFCSPTCYTTVPYYSEVPLKFTDTSGRGFLARFRLATARAEHQPVTVDDLHLPLDYVPRQTGDSRAQDYLRQAFAARLDAQQIDYELHIQLYPLTSGDDRTAMDCTLDWNADQHPWRRLGNLSLETRLSPEEEAALCFNVSSPDGFLKVPATDDPHHPASLNYLRSFVYHESAKARGALEKKVVSETTPTTNNSREFTRPVLSVILPTEDITPIEISRLFAECARKLYACHIDLPHAEFIEAAKKNLEATLAAVGIEANAAIDAVLKAIDLEKLCRRMAGEIRKQTPPSADLAPILAEAGRNNLDWYNGTDRQDQIRAMDAFTQIIPEPAFRTSGSIDKYGLVLWERKDTSTYFSRLTFMDKPQIQTRMAASPYYLVQVDDDFAVILLRANTNANIEETQINDSVSPITEYIFLLSRDAGEWGLIGVFNSQGRNAPNRDETEVTRYVRHWIEFADAASQPEVFHNSMKNNMLHACFLENLFRALMQKTAEGPAPHRCNWQPSSTPFATWPCGIATIPVLPSSVPVPVGSPAPIT